VPGVNASVRRVGLGQRAGSAGLRGMGVQELWIVWGYTPV